MILVRKVIEHVYDKMLGQSSDTNSQMTAGNNTNSASNKQEKSEQEHDEDWSSTAEEKIELLCNDQVCPIVSVHVSSLCVCVCVLNRFKSKLTLYLVSFSCLIQTWI